MFKFRSYNVKKATEKNEKEQPSTASKTPSYTAATLKKPPKKEKEKATANKINAISNKESPEYRRSTSARISASANATVKKWTPNKTYVPKKQKEDEKKNNESVNLHKKLERQ